MFKFMKSKKGFTLVELMIVVVIMAILVAVAVPIFSAVTKNARIKTCEANRREIVSQLNNYAMGSVDGIQHTATEANKGTIEITTANDGTAALNVGATFITEDAFRGLFQEVPVCPRETAKITVTITPVEEVEGVDQTAVITVECDSHTGGDAEVK